MVLAELERHSEQLKEVDDKLNKIRNEDLAGIRSEIAVLKMKAGIWGAAAGLVPGVAVMIFVILKGS